MVGHGIIREHEQCGVVFDLLYVRYDVRPFSGSDTEGLACRDVGHCPHATVSLSRSAGYFFMFVKVSMDCEWVFEHTCDSLDVFGSAGFPNAKIDCLLSCWLFHVVSMFVADVDNVSC